MGRVNKALKATGTPQLSVRGTGDGTKHDGDPDAHRAAPIQ